MPKPLFGDNGSGMHTHQSLWKKGKPLFAGNEYARPLADGALLHRRHPEARPGAGGVLQSDDQQLQAAGARLRSAGEPGLLRAQPFGGDPHPDLSQSPKAKRIEYRPPDPAANPYLAFTALLMAGLDGVLNKIDPGEPMDKNIYELPPEEAKIPPMPGSLAEALRELENDHEFLLKGDVFTQDLDRHVDRLQAQERHDPMRLRPHPYEFYLYYDV